MDLSEKIVSQTRKNWKSKQTNKNSLQIILNERTRKPDHYRIIYGAPKDEER